MYIQACACNKSFGPELSVMDVKPFFFFFYQKEKDCF